MMRDYNTCAVLSPLLPRYDRFDAMVVMRC